MDYTHKFKFKLNDIKIVGDCEFNLDGKASFQTDESLPNLTIDQLRSVEELFRTLRSLFVQFEGSLKKIEVNEK